MARAFSVPHMVHLELLAVGDDEEVSSGTLEKSTRPLPSWERKVIGTPPVRKGGANYIPLTSGRRDQALRVGEAQSS